MNNKLKNKADRAGLSDPTYELERLRGGCMPSLCLSCLCTEYSGCCQNSQTPLQHTITEQFCPISRRHLISINTTVVSPKQPWWSINPRPSRKQPAPPNVRCLVGLYGSLKDSSFENLNRLVEEDRDEQEILRYAISHEESDEVRFLVGSQSLKPQGSQVTLVTLVESLDIDLKKQTFSHPNGEVTSLVTLASKPDCFISLSASYSNERPELRNSARLWRIPNLNENLLDDAMIESNLSKSPVDNNNSSTANNSLDYVTTLPLDKYHSIKRITSHPSSTCCDLACVVGPPIEIPGSAAYSSLVTTATTSYLVILQASSNSNSSDYQISTSVQLYLPPSSPSDSLRTNMKSSTGCLSTTASPNAIRWSPHEHSNQLAIAFDNGILGWDVRCMKPSFWMENAHWPCVRDIDYNPHRPNLLVSGGDDGIMRLWDLRYLRTRYRCLSTTAAVSAKNTAISNASERIMQYGTEPTVQPLFAIASHSHWVGFFSDVPLLAHILKSTK
ncbi:unnamed protein product [Schistosoma mattheei]|uniref:Uncharacterized protein n=1 Tax=Schistosoma mattheei TaxID=31246 RepID=A0A183PCL0_9TREM|nr:unnamed protein product [Schistosoma mattheei]